MKVRDICEKLGASVSVEGNPEREISSVTVGDLLSYVMGTAPEGAMWITIQVHLNVAAVAVLKDIPLILIAGGRPPADDLVARCTKEGICVAVVPDDMYGACVRVASLGIQA